MYLYEIETNGFTISDFVSLWKMLAFGFKGEIT